MKALREAYKNVWSQPGSHVLINVNIKKYRYFRYAYGEQEAHELLVRFKKILQSAISEDDVCMQVYQDDFAILMKYEDQEQLIDWIHHLVDVIFDIDHPIAHHNIYASFGLFCLDDPACSFEEAWDKAQFCRSHSISISTRVFCYEFYEDSVLRAYLDTCRMEEFTAKAREQQQYQIYIQPKVEAKTGKIIGGETLLRLFYEGEMIAASKFLPILNKNGYIRMIDQENYEMVIKAMDERFKQGKRNVTISFNISNSYFYDEFLVRDYCNILDCYQVDPKYLELEFMESIHMEETQLKSYVDAFHAKGFSCALDDFGNGYSNFKLLSSCDIDTVKIDRVFFEIPHNEKARAALRTIIELLRLLKVQIVAEGVEQREDVDFLKEAGCDAIQGYYFYKPMPMEAFFALLDEDK